MSEVEESSVTSGLLSRVLLHGLATLRSQQLLCDVTLRVGDKTFSAHRVVLAAVSPYFSAMFSCGYSDMNAKEILLNDVNAESLATVLDFIYTSKLKILDVDVISVLHLADYLQISTLKCLCAEYLMRNMNVITCEKVCEVAEALELHDLYNMSKKYISKIEIADNAQQVPDETEQVILVAGGHDGYGHTLRTAECLTKVDGSFRWRHSHPPRFQNVEESSDTLAVMSTSRAEAAYVTSQTDLYVIGGKQSANFFLSSVEKFNLFKNTWEQLAPLPVELSDAAATLAHNNRIFVIGGRTNKDWDKRVWIYNIESNHWHQGPNLPQCRIQHAAATWHNAIYVLGGKTEQEVGGTSSVLVLECGASEWLPVAPMQRPRAQFACTTANGFLYAIGGTNGIHTLAQAEKYDLLMDRWTTIADYRFPLEGSCAVTHITQSTRSREHQLVESVVCIGGSDGSEATNRVERLGVSGEQWHWLPELYTRRSHCVVGVLRIS